MPENRANWPLLVPQKSEFDDRPEALFSLWGLDFKLIDCSEELKDRAGTAS